MCLACAQHAAQDTAAAGQTQVLQQIMLRQQAGPAALGRPCGQPPPRPTCALVAFCFSWSKAPARKVSAHTCGATTAGAASGQAGVRTAGLRLNAAAARGEGMAASHPYVCFPSMRQVVRFQLPGPDNPITWLAFSTHHGRLESLLLEQVRILGTCGRLARTCKEGQGARRAAAFEVSAGSASGGRAVYRSRGMQRRSCQKRRF